MTRTNQSTTILDFLTSIAEARYKAEADRKDHACERLLEKKTDPSLQPMPDIDY